ncbi:acetolactate synthase small subunit [Klebsiella pneumoniae]|uniref:Acetolactate synthase small subunit n=1 Tax=Klebsiella pneumoniae TaxID=573 RepID=A0A2X3EPB4_KLEPN|nr:acetolactate synthase small subunit [Klebsiella pneumoniae]
MLVKVQASGYGREEVKRNTEIFRGQIIDVTLLSIPSSSPAPVISWMHFWPRCAMSLGLWKWLAPAWSACLAVIKSCAKDRELL